MDFILRSRAESLPELVPRTCLLCREHLQSPYLELGDLPPCNRFEDAPVEIERHQLTLTECESCGLIQLVDPMPLPSVVPRHSWIRYNEPEAHLDDVVEHLRPLLTEGGVCLGISPFEGPLHGRLAAAGMLVRSASLPASAAPGRYPYLETWQDALERGEFQRESDRGADLVSCRYLLEHCRSPHNALHALFSLASEDGHILVEVPDSATFLRAGDYAFPWEEHTTYFTEATLLALCRAAGFDVVEFLRYAGELEDAMVVILRRGTPRRMFPPRDAVFSDYLSRFTDVRARVRSTIEAQAAKDPGSVALFGVGHQAIMFANVFGIAHLFGAVVDDDPNKRGLVPPGFRVPITGSGDLLANARIATCLLAVSPRALPKIKDLLRPLSDRGVRLQSIFAGVPGSIVSGAMA